MKKALTLLLMALPILVFSQTKSIQNFYSKYKDHENITALTLSGKPYSVCRFI